VLDANGCSVVTNSVIIANPALLTASASGSLQVSCFDAADGTLTVSALGGTGAYSYSLNGGTSQISNIFSGLSAGTYSVEVLDANGCLALADLVIIQNPLQLSASIGGHIPVSCFGGADGQIAIIPYGGNGQYIYSINGSTPQYSNLFMNLVAGDYEFDIYDSNYCSASVSFVLNQPEEIVPDYETYCHSGIVGIEINATGGVQPYSYSIDGGINFQEYNIFDKLNNSSTVELVIKDSKNCLSNSIFIPVESLNTLETSINILSENKCYGVSDASIEVIIRGGVYPYYFSIDNGSTTSDVVVNEISAGDHEVLVYDSNGCPSVANFSIMAQEEITVDIEKTNADCSGNIGGSVNLIVNGGNEPYSYTWSNEFASAELYNLEAGVYYVTVSDRNSCELVRPIIIETEELADIPQINNSFSPNADGINDLWVIDNLELYPDNELVVLNRWGNEVLTANGYQNDWNGSQLGEGTYFYILKVNVCSGYKVFDGFITILR
jgi:gliding motility-associated-like protein